MQKIQLLIVLLTALLLTGCGPKGLQTYYVEGIVTLDGEPVEGAQVLFLPMEQTPDSKTASGLTDASGKYTLTADGGLPGKGAVDGEYRVTVKKVEIVAARGAPKPEYDTGRPPTEYTEQKVITPPRYSLPGQTPLKVTVKKEKNDIPLALEKK